MSSSTIGQDRTVVIVDTGTANIGSLRAGLSRFAGCVQLSTDAEVVKNATHVCVPGVSSYAASARGLRDLGLTEVVRQRILDGKNTLLVCVGLQLLATSSAEQETEEERSIPGIGVINAHVERLPETVRVPQQAWNFVRAPSSSSKDARDRPVLLTESGFAYFSNSYCLRSAPLGWHTATTTHGVDFVAAIEKNDGRVLAAQFHPELSGAFGRRLLRSWIETTPWNAVDSASSSASSTAPKRQSTQTHRIIPCLDVSGGRVVKGVQFQGLVDAGDPVTQAMHYEAHGADEIVMLDISATPDQRRTHAELVTALSNSLSIPLTVGGGIKTVDDAVRLLNAGADKVSLNTAAVRTPALIGELASKFGRQCVVLAIDAVQTGPAAWEVVVSCGKERTGMDVVEWARVGVAKGAGEILLTSFDRDGTKAGYDCELLRAVTAAVSVPVIASGGASGYEHMLDAFHAGADAVLAASIFHYNEVTCNDLKTSLSNRGVAMRTQLDNHRHNHFSAAAVPTTRRSFPRGSQCLVPSIDIMDGHVVQLVGGDPNAKKVDAGADAVAIARRFAVAGEVAVVDLNAALGKGNNIELIKQLLAVAPCRVGGGIRTIEAAREWLDAGAAKIVIGTAATPEFLQQLPRERVVAALDALQGEVVVHGWQTKTGRSVVDQIKLLRPYVGGFLVTFVEREGRMAGIDLKAIEEIATAVYFPDAEDSSSLPCTLTIAGGVTTVDDLRALDALGAEGQVGMAIYTDHLDLGSAIASPMISDRPDGLFPTVVTDQYGASLGLVYSSVESVSMAAKLRQGVYFSRSRNELWVKGSTSGAVQTLLRIEMDCDRDSFRFVVQQQGSGFCHRPSYYGCFGNGRPERPIDALASLLRGRLESAPAGSYTAKLFTDHKMLSAKLIEEATELAEATDPEHVAEETADLLYFALVAAVKAGVTIADVENVLHRRSLKVSRRPGLAKPQFLAAVESSLAAAPTASTSAAAPTTPSTSAAAPAAPALVAASTAEEKAPLLRIKGSEDIMAMQPDPVDPAARDIAIAIVKDVRERGQVGLLEQAVRLGDLRSIEDPWILQRDVLEAAYNAQPVDIQEMLQRVAGRIRQFAEAQLNSLTKTMSITVEGAGNKAGQSVAPMDTAGCYAPGGRYPLPSSILMTAIPARVAGCSVVVGASPRPAPITLAAAHVAGVDFLLTVGGAQAIAALAYGVRESNGSGRQLVPACDVVVGPGNRFVTAAKQIVSGIVAIDMLAGPSECLVVVDETSDVSVAAADLIAQAEHDIAAVPILIVVGSESIVQEVEREVDRQLEADLATTDTARQSFLRNGYAVVVPTREQAVVISDRIAPEHLEIHTREPAQLGALMKHYGAMFVGSSSAEVLGDYGFGPNHTLPTGGTARSFGGLSVFTFLRVRTWIDIADLSTCQSSIRDAVQLAKLEGLIGHSRSAEKRLIVQEETTTSQQSSSAATSASDGTDGVNFAVPKGRMFDGIIELLTDAGISLKVDARNLRPTISLPDWTVKLLKPRNVVEMLDHGTRDIGFAGADIVQELKANNIVSYFDTRLDIVRIVVAVPPHFIDKASGVLLPDRHYRIATEYVELTRQWVAKNKLDAEIIRTSGSTEVFPPEDADFIIDNTATGTTLRANGLVIYETLMHSSTQLFIHRSVLDNPRKKQQLDNFVMLLSGALAAREHVLLEFNVPNKAALDSLINFVPSLRRPTVSQLAEDDGFAVRSAIARSSISRLVPLIKAHGGSDVILSRVDQIVR